MDISAANNSFAEAILSKGMNKGHGREMRPSPGTPEQPGPPESLGPPALPRLPG